MSERISILDCHDGPANGPWHHRPAREARFRCMMRGVGAAAKMPVTFTQGGSRRVSAGKKLARWWPTRRNVCQRRGRYVRECYYLGP